MAEQEKVEELLVKFKNLTLPSRSSDNSSRSTYSLSDGQVQQLLECLKQKEKSLLDFRKLREIVVASHTLPETAKKVYEASADYALGEGEFAEFLGVANRLIKEYYYYSPCDTTPTIKQDQVYCALLLLYSLEVTSQDLSHFFYRLPLNIKQAEWVAVAMQLPLAIKAGNIRRFEIVWKQELLSTLSKSLHDHLRKECLQIMSITFQKAYQVKPDGFIARLSTNEK